MSLSVSRRRLIGLTAAAAVLSPLAAAASKPAAPRRAAGPRILVYALKLEVTSASGLPEGCFAPDVMPWTRCRTGDVVSGWLRVDLSEARLRYDFDIAGLRSVIRGMSDPELRAFDARTGAIRFSDHTWQDHESFRIEEQGSVALEHDEVALRFDVLDHAVTVSDGAKGAPSLHL